MKALILNSGLGRRMGEITTSHPKCMTALAGNETILSRQLRQLEACGIRNIVITTGPFTNALESHARSNVQGANLTFVNNPYYASTNYIYSIYLAREYLKDDILMMHGDLVFLNGILEDILTQSNSSITVSSTLPLPEKDFKAVVRDGRVCAIGVEFFDGAMAAQPLYMLQQREWFVWLAEIDVFVRCGDTGCYAENALNRVSEQCYIRAFDVQNRLCEEIDTSEDLMRINKLLMEKEGTN